MGKQVVLPNTEAEWREYVWELFRRVMDDLAKYDVELGQPLRKSKASKELYAEFEDALREAPASIRKEFPKRS